MLCCEIWTAHFKGVFVRVSDAGEIAGRWWKGRGVEERHEL